MTEEVEKIYEFIAIRKLIEVWCAKKAAEFVTAKELKRMEKALSEMEKLVDSKEILGQPDIDFHIAIAEASHNTLMVHLMTTVKQIFFTMFKISNFIRRSENKIQLQHQEVMRQLRAESNLAAQKMERHLNLWRGMERRDQSPRSKRRLKLALMA
jgi:GntR family transcriptional repressor for pyruvate dehydrogenase complex